MSTEEAGSRTCQAPDLGIDPGDGKEDGIFQQRNPPSDEEAHGSIWRKRRMSSRRRAMRNSESPVRDFKC